MKRISCVLCALVMIWGVCGCSFKREYLNKEEIYALVDANQQQILDCIASDEFAPVLELSPYISISSGENYIDFYCGGKGLSVSGKDYGFYYSTDDLPLPCHSWDGWLELEQDGKGWSCSGFYTEKICDHFYYYEASF